MEAGARASTIKVVAAAIAQNHKDAGFDVPLRHGVARTVFEDLTQDDSPVPTRALPLDLDFYRAIRKTAYEPRNGRVGRMERATNARRRGALDVAMIGPDAGRQAPGGRGGGVDLGRPGAGARRFRPCARLGGRVPRCERRHHEARCRQSAGEPTTTSRSWA